MKRLLVIMLLGLSFQLYSQTQGAVNSPFSRFGIGDIATENPMFIRQMGGIGTAYLDVVQLNFENPATLGYLTQTAFDLGLDFKRSRLQDEFASSSQTSGNLGYLALGFPLRNPTNALFSREDYKFNWGMGFAVIPNSTVSYDISRQDELDGEAFDRNFIGNGGSYKAIMGNAVKIGDLSVGLSLGWLFGNIDYRRQIDFISNRVAFDNDFSSSYSFRGIYSKLGITYLQVLNRAASRENPNSIVPKSLTYGITYKPSIGIKTKAEILDLGLISEFGLVDTLLYTPLQEGSGRLPSELSFGVVYTHGYKYAIGADFKRTNWSQYENDANPEELTNTTRIGVGGFYRPNYTSTSMLQRTSYRLGFYYEESPQNIENNQIKSFGLTAGVGLPLAWQRKFSQLNLGVDIGKRSVSNILRENFVKVTFGFTFNESDWFRRYYLN